MKTFSVNEALREFGVNVLTGEACAYSLRQLCDLNQNGVNLITEYLGMRADTVFNANWNSTVNGEPAIASIMLDHSFFDPFIIFCMFKAGVPLIIKSLCYPVSYCAYSAEDMVNEVARIEAAEGQALRDSYKIYRNPKPSSASSRNLHVFTGRMD